MEGQLPPSVVIRELDLTREYGMSRTPIREALHRLHGEGMIRRVGPGGYIAHELGPKELSDLYQLREVLVGLAARLAAQNRSRIDVATLEDTLDALDRAFSEDAADEADELIRAFFHQIADASRNEYLRSTFGRLTDLFRYKALAVTHPQWRDELRVRHRRLVDAIASSDEERAERLARELIVKSLAIRLEHFGQPSAQVANLGS